MANVLPKKDSVLNLLISLPTHGCLEDEPDLHQAKPVLREGAKGA